MKTAYDGLIWTIDGGPIGSSTPDDMYELSYEAIATCPKCGEEIKGIAMVMSFNEDMSGNWIECVEYDPCECEDEE